VSVYRALADAAHRRNLGEIEAAEEVQFDQLGQRRVDLRKGVEGLRQGPKIFDLCDHLSFCACRCQMKAAAVLEGSALAHVVDDQAAHGARGVGEEARTIGKRQGALAQSRQA